MRDRVLGYVAIALLVLLGFIAYALAGGSEHFHWVYGLILVAVGVGSGRAGLPLRVLYFVPIWFVGLLVTGYGLHRVWGGWGLAGGIALVIGGAVAVFAGLVVQDERRYLAQTPARLDRARACAARGDGAAAFRELGVAFQIPSGPGPSCHMARRTLGTALSLRDVLRLTADQASVLEAADEILAGPCDDPDEIEQAILGETAEILTTRGALPPSGRVLSHVQSRRSEAAERS